VPTDPNLKIHHDNAFNWYDFDSGGGAMNSFFTTVDDRTATLKEDPSLRNLRVGRRRFIALIDRSILNPLPRIVAVKDFPDY
jgi:hypothetical protein